MKAQITLKTEKFNAKLDAMMARGRDMRAYFKSVVQPQFFKAQAQRFQTENSSEGSVWEALTPRYKVWKMTRYAAFPGGGRRMMVATSQIFNSVVGRDKSGMSIITEPTRISFVINTSKIPYAAHAAEHRPYMTFGRRTRREILEGIKDYYFHGKTPRGLS